MSEKAKTNDNLFLLGMILSMTCWGFSWTSGKILSSYGNAMTISFLRFALTFASLIFILPVLRTKLTITRAGIFDLIMASVMISVYTFLFFHGLVTGKAGAGGVLVTVLNPIISYGIMLVMARRKPNRNETLGLLLGLAAGVILLKLFTDAESILHAGNIFFLFAAFSWAILSVFTSRSSRYGAPLTFSFYMYGISTILMFFVTGLSSLRETLMKSDRIFWGNLFFSATITTALATTFYFVATARIGASKASSFIFLVPISAALGSWFFLGEAPQADTILGGLLGIGAVYILNKKSEK
ncbi:MAG TPA: DMT family transporter [Chryseolinea sp.]|nr:DMT family transporter [Chryseolinea sp.]